MWQNWVGDQVRRANRNLLLVNAVLVLVTVIVAGANWRYLNNVLRGPKSIVPQSLVRIQDPDRLDRYYFEVTGLHPETTGVSYVRRKNGSETTEWVLLAARVDGKYLLVKAKREAPQVSYTGYLEPPARDLKLKLLEQVSAAAYDRTFYPYVLDATDFSTGGLFGMIAGIGLALIGLFNVGRALARGGDYSRSPIVQKLARFGAPPETTAMAIDTEFRQGPATFLPGTWFTRSWYLRRSFYDFEAVPLGDIGWVYQRVVTHYQAFIPVSKSRELVIYDRNGKRLGAGGREKGIVATMSYLAQRLPWIPLGYSKEWEGIIKKDPRQFAQLIDQRRAQFYEHLNAQQRQATV